MKDILAFLFLVNIVFSEDCTVTQDVEIVKDAAVLESAQLGFDYNNYPPGGTINNLAEARDWADTDSTCLPFNYYSFYGNTQDGARCGLSINPNYLYTTFPGSVYAKEECVCPANQYRLNVKDIGTRAACKLASKYAWDVASSGNRYYLKMGGTPDFSLSFEECNIYGRGTVKNVSWNNARGCIRQASTGEVAYNTKDGGACGSTTGDPWPCVEKASSPRYRISLNGRGETVSKEECMNITNIGTTVLRLNSFYEQTTPARAPGCIYDDHGVSWNEGGTAECPTSGNDFTCVRREGEMGVFANREFGLNDNNPNHPSSDSEFYYKNRAGATDGSGGAYGCFLYQGSPATEYRIIWAVNGFTNKLLSKSPRVVVYNGKYDLESNMPKITECKNCSSVPEGHVLTAKCGDALKNNFLRDTRVKSCTPGKDFSANVNDTDDCTPCTPIPWNTRPNDELFVASPCTVSSDTVLLTKCNGTAATNPEIKQVQSWEECKNISILSRQQANATRVETAPGFFPYGTWNGWKIGLYLFEGESPALPLTRFDDGLYSFGDKTDGQCKLYWADDNVMAHRIIWDGKTATFPNKNQGAVISKTEGKYVLADYYRKCGPVCGPGYGGNHCSLCAITEYNNVSSSMGTACNKKKCPVGKGSPKLTNYNASEVDSETEDCVDCPTGEFSPNDDDGQCGICASIKAGHELVSICNSSSDTVTRPCDANSYQPEEIAWNAWNENASCKALPAATPDTGKYVAHSIKITGLTVAQANANKPQIRKGIASALVRNTKDIINLKFKSSSRRRRLLEQAKVVVEYQIVVLDKQESDMLLADLKTTNFQTSLQGELGMDVGVESNDPVYIFPACKTKNYDNYVDSSIAVQDKELCKCDSGRIFAVSGCIGLIWFIFIIAGAVLALICIIMFIYSCVKNNKIQTSPNVKYTSLAYQPRKPRYRF